MGVQQKGTLRAGQRFWWLLFGKSVLGRVIGREEEEVV